MMHIKFVDYKIEHKGYWDYGFQYWLIELSTTEKGKPQSLRILTTNDLNEITNKLQELFSQDIQITFEENESLKQHKHTILQNENLIQ